MDAIGWQNFVDWFIVSILKKYVNGIFLSLGKFPSKIYFYLKVQEIK